MLDCRIQQIGKSIEIDKYKYGPKVELMDIAIFKAIDYSKTFFSTSNFFKKSKINTLAFLKKATTENIPSKLCFE